MLLIFQPILMLLTGHGSQTDCDKPLSVLPSMARSACYRAGGVCWEEHSAEVVESLLPRLFFLRI
jgi:hypothetical protein